MNKQEAYNKIKETITELGSPSEYMWEYSGFEPDETDTSDIVKLFEGEKVVYHKGGEGQGEHFETVWHFPVPDIYISFYGWYASHVGSEYEGMMHVEPVQVMRTEYHGYDPNRVTNK